MTKPAQHDQSRPPRRPHRGHQEGALRRPRPALRRGRRRGPPRRRGRPSDRPLRRPGAALGRVLDGHRPEHGRHQAGGAEAVRRRRATPSDLDPSQGFSRFTPRARNVVVAAQNEARAAGNDEIRPETPGAGAAERAGRRSPRKAIVAQGVALDDRAGAATATLPPPADRGARRSSRTTPARRRRWSSRSARRCGWATTTSAPSTSCSRCWSSRTAPACSPASASTRRPPRPTSARHWPPRSPRGRWADAGPTPQ